MPSNLFTIIIVRTLMLIQQIWCLLLFFVGWTFLSEHSAAAWAAVVYNLSTHWHPTCVALIHQKQTNTRYKFIIKLPIAVFRMTTFHHTDTDGFRRKNGVSINLIASLHIDVKQSYLFLAGPNKPYFDLYFIENNGKLELKDAIKFHCRTSVLIYQRPATNITPDRP